MKASRTSRGLFASGPLSDLRAPGGLFKLSNLAARPTNVMRPYVGTPCIVAVQALGIHKRAELYPTGRQRIGKRLVSALDSRVSSRSMGKPETIEPLRSAAEDRKCIALAAVHRDLGAAIEQLK